MLILTSKLVYLVAISICMQYVMAATPTIDPDLGRQCIIGLHDCPEGQVCLPEDENYGHCGYYPQKKRARLRYK